MKIGQEITIREDFEINSIVSNTAINIKEGDKAFLDSKGFLHITTGKGRGKIVKMDGIEPTGYDYGNISKMILNRLNGVFGLEIYLDDEEIDKQEIIDEIEDVLIDIL